MKIKAFQVEEWMNAYENGARYNIAETCVDSISLAELFDLTGEDRQSCWDSFCCKRLTYGDIEGAPLFKQGISSLYRTIRPEDIITTHGAAGANHHVFYSLIEPGDRVITVMPTYQQLYSIPESYGAEVVRMQLKIENGYQLDLAELERLAVPGTKMICINNPNNPTGVLLSGEELRRIVAIARKAGAWLLCDEVYRHLTQEAAVSVYVSPTEKPTVTPAAKPAAGPVTENRWSESVADLYEKGISVSSMSKVFSLAGLRLGWIASRDQDVIRACISHRDYNLISGSVFDEAIAGVALKHSETLLERSRGIIRRNLEIVDQWVAQQPGVYYHKPAAGTTALVYYHTDMPSEQFCRELYHQTGALVTPGDCFAVERCFRLGYACDTAELKAGLAAVSRFLENGLTG